jgi:hypothetical protein
VQKKKMDGECGKQFEEKEEEKEEKNTGRTIPLLRRRVSKAIWDLGFGIWDLGFGIWDLG